MLNQFNEGGSHEENPNGGIPIGQDALVEQGETMKDNFVYSDRIALTPEIATQFNLPKSLVGKSMAEISSKINDMFKDRNSSIDNSTKNKMLDKIAQAQETIKAEQQAQIQAAMEANQSQMPEGLSNQVPQGMEEYTEPVDNSQEEGMEQYPQNVSTMQYGGYRPIIFPKKMSTGGQIDEKKGRQMEGAIGALDMVGDFIKPINTGIDTSGNNPVAIPTMNPTGNVASNALSMTSKGAQVGTALGGPGLGTAIGAGVGLVGGVVKGIMGNKKMRNDINKAQSNNAYLASEGFQDFAYGGKIKMANGGPQPYTPEDYTPYFSMSRMNEDYTPYFSMSRANPKILPYDNTNDSIIETPKIEGKVPFKKKRLGINPKEIGKAATQIGMLAPAIGNLAQLHKLKKSKADFVAPIENSAKYIPQYADTERGINLANSAYNANVKALENASRGSNAALRANLTGMGYNRMKALNDMYQNASAVNNAEYGKAFSINNATNEANINRQIQAAEETAMNKATRENAISEGNTAVFGAVGDFAKQHFNAKNIGKMTGYNIYGEYLQDPATGAWFTLDGKPATTAEVQNYLNTKKAEGKAFGGKIRKTKYRF